MSLGAPPVVQIAPIRLTLLQDERCTFSTHEPRMRQSADETSAAASGGFVVCRWLFESAAVASSELRVHRGVLGKFLGCEGENWVRNETGASASGGV